MGLTPRSKRWAFLSLTATTMTIGTTFAGTQDPLLESTANDYFQRGTQPLSGGLSSGVNVDLDPMIPSLGCAGCHAGYGPQGDFDIVEPFGPWASSMMGQSARDPVFHAGLAITKQDLGDVGAQFCIRCHAPNAFLEGRTPTEPAELTAIDKDGVSCNFCHRLVNPAFEKGVSPADDVQILADLTEASWVPPESSNARYVISPGESRRGPFPVCEAPPDCGPDDVPMDIEFIHGVPTLGSEFHKAAELCWNCHGVSNPLFTRQEDDTYVLNDTDAAHPTGLQSDMMPLHRTYQEWKNSYYSTTGVQHDPGRFGGTNTGPMGVCQDCHMPDTQGYGCTFNFPPFFERTDVPQHSFMGSNTWVLKAVRALYPDGETGMTEASVDSMIARNTNMLQAATDLVLSEIGSQVNVRVINRGGHKVPTGFPDGRRMWINVKFFDCYEGAPILEHGFYDFDTADLTTLDTKVYEIILGLDAAQAATTGLPQGDSFHFMLANEILKDNRIPPAGWFQNTAEANQTMPVGASYSNGQHWDDTLFEIPATATKAVVTVYYQLNSKEFMEFLRDENVDQSPTSAGMIAYEQYELHGMSTPVVMDMAEIDLTPVFDPSDIDQSGQVNTSDLLILLANWGVCDPPPPTTCTGDVDCDGTVSITDLLALLAAWNS